MKRDFFYDEEVIAKKIYKNGFQDESYSRWQATMVAKYFRWTLGYGDARIKSSLIKFCEKYDQNFNEVRQARSIKNAVSESKNEYVKKASPILITKLELDIIKSIRNFKAQKILLGFLIYAKRDKGYVNRRNWTDVKRIAGLKINKKELNSFVRIFYEMGIIEIKGNSHFIKFINPLSDSVFLIQDEKTLYNLGNSYKEFCGGELAWCLICGKEFIRNGRTHHFCNECSKEKEWKRRWIN